MGKSGDVVLGCFDLGPTIVDGIIDGTVAYAIDQQQFLQGYIPVAVLHLNHRNGTLQLVIFYQFRTRFCNKS